MIDPIAEMLTNIRNAVMARHGEVIIPRSKYKLRLATIFQEEGYIEKVEEIRDTAQGHLKLTLRFTSEDRKEGPIHEIRMISKPGQRIYVKKDSLPRVKQGLGISIVSTSQGLMTAREAKKRSLGGEIICQVW